MNSFARYMGMEDRVGERRFCNERTVGIFDLNEGITAAAAFESFAMEVAFGVNKLGLKGEKVDYVSTMMRDGKVSIRLITRTRAQRFLAKITRSF